MPGWKVDPGGVERVLNATLDESQSLMETLGGSEDGTVSGVDSVAQEAVVATQSQPVGDAVVAFFDDQKPVLEGIANHIHAALAGAGAATQAIVDGDETMAADTQAEAIRAASTGDFSKLDGD